MTKPAICACCGEVTKANTPEQEAEAQKEFEDLYGMGPAADNDHAIVCDLCFKKFYAWMMVGPTNPQEVA